MKATSIIFPQKNEVAVVHNEISGPKSGELLCRARKSLISTGTETLCLRGEFDPGTNWIDWVKYPFAAGYSMQADVIEAGEGVERFCKGDRINAIIPHVSLFCINEKSALPTPDYISDSDATFVLVSMTAQLGIRRADIKLGETAVIIGVGLIGLMTLQYLSLMGCRRIIVIDTAQTRLDIAGKMGATHIIEDAASNAVEQIRELTNGHMADIVFDATGHPAVLSQSVALCRKLGRVILVGDTTHPNSQYVGPGVVSNSVGILGIHAGCHPAEYSEFTPWPRSEMASLLFEYIKQGKISMDPLITGIHNPLHAPDVYNELINNRSKHIAELFDWDLLN